MIFFKDVYTVKKTPRINMCCTYSKIITIGASSSFLGATQAKLRTNQISVSIK